MHRNLSCEFIIKFFRNKQVKANHPITVLNTEEWFTPTEMKIDDNKIYVRWEGSCWFNIEQCDVRTIN